MQLFLISFISIFFNLLSFAIIARILLSWMRADGAGRIRMIIYDMTEPVLAPFRRSFFRIGVIDISPLVVLFLLDICKSLLVDFLSYLFQII